MTEKNRSRAVFVDFGELRKQREQFLGRPLTKMEEDFLFEADAIKLDSLATGRSIATTVDNLEISGDKVSDAVKSFLGLIPPVN